MLAYMRWVGKFVSKLALTCVFHGLEFFTHGLVFAQRHSRFGRLASVTKTMEAAAVSAMVQAGIDAYFRRGAPSIGALYRLGALVLVSVSNLFTWASLSISVQLGHRHDSACMLLQSGEWLIFRNRG